MEQNLKMLSRNLYFWLQTKILIKVPLLFSGQITSMDGRTVGWSWRTTRWATTSPRMRRSTAAGVPSAWARLSSLWVSMSLHYKAALFLSVLQYVFHPSAEHCWPAVLCSWMQPDVCATSAFSKRLTRMNAVVCARRLDVLRERNRQSLFELPDSRTYCVTHPLLYATWEDTLWIFI